MTVSNKDDPQDSALLTREAILGSSRRAQQYLLSLQKTEGDWEGEMVWCSMILAQAVIVRTITGHPYTESEKRLIVRHFSVTQATDGSWGMHPESPGYVFFTTLAYVALRLLGLSPQDDLPARGLSWIHAQPQGVKAIPTWGKFWLALLDLYDYRGLNSVPPELFLLPEWLPFHPRRYYCHTRQIYLAIAYLFGLRFRAELPDGLRDSLRQELYGDEYAQIDFAALRHLLAPSDVYVPITPLLRGVYDLLAAYESVHSKALRNKALGLCLKHIVYELKVSNYQGISPVSGLLNCLVLFATDKQHPELAPSLAGIETWRWQDEEEGLRYVGAHSNTWDTAFVLQALAEMRAPAPEVNGAVNRAHAFLARAQIVDELPDYQSHWRDSALGGWCFSDGRHRWPVSDCAAEALSALLSLYEHPDMSIDRPFERLRLDQAADFILSRQNADGGFGTYERRRGGKLLEKVNPSEMFGQCMTELSYIECTSSSLAALAHYRKRFPSHTITGLNGAIARAVTFLRAQQLKDGSFQGFWGINYTYACFHVVRSLRMAEVAVDDGLVQSVAQWLLTHQKPDGGWGEHYTSCLGGRYIEHEQSQVVMTGWALMALVEVCPHDHVAIRRGYGWLLTQQLESGAWPRQAVNGVFFGAAMLDYRLYHSYFPAWAIFRLARLLGE
ncbi:2,3-oxidosqualene cyclase [Candidatus Methylospira mobilis]|uniref:2,3-oxidosqualene cyclase n=1 Tax=Candidatus Methylospira mobilis TaxID=1808979 RepID=A0A5Q0BMG5_9GAMM|nr:2,3-oxidosqualene cyclase [Candidatus Methylospira mobilis]QFY44799.1 2,3-oxidosqualene cyclase [Candidatus Methylospira mobilis]